MQKNKRKFVQGLINMRDHCINQFENNGETDNSLIGLNVSEVINNFVVAYFGDRHKRLCVNIFSPYMSHQDCAKILNNNILSYIYDENASDMTCDWRELYVLNEEFNKNEDDIF